MNTFHSINTVRLHKKLFLPFELFGINGDQNTSCSENDKQTSDIIWTFKQPKTTQPTRSQYNAWNRMITWMKNQPINTIMDFKSLFYSK